MGVLILILEIVRKNGAMVIKKPMHAMNFQGMFGAFGTKSKGLNRRQETSGIQVVLDPREIISFLMALILKKGK